MNFGFSLWLFLQSLSTTISNTLVRSIVISGDLPVWPRLYVFLKMYLHILKANVEIVFTWNVEVEVRPIKTSS